MHNICSTLVTCYFKIPAKNISAATTLRHLLCVIGTCTVSVIFTALCTSNSPAFGKTVGFRCRTEALVNRRLNEYSNENKSRQSKMMAFWANVTPILGWRLLFENHDIEMWSYTHILMFYCL